MVLAMAWRANVGAFALVAVTAGCSLTSLDELTRGAPPRDDAGAAGIGGTNGAGGSAGASGSGGGALPGGPCPEDGAYACAGRAQNRVVECVNGYWRLATECRNGQLCDSSAPPSVADRCKSPVADCLGQDPGSTLCIGADLVRCGPDLVTTETLDTCGSAQLCLLATEDQCAACTDGEYRCTGATLERCATDHAGFVTVDTCSSTDLCNAGAGACTSTTCVTNQYRCTNDTLERCNSALDGFDVVEQCGSGLCDATGGECDVCVPGTKSCKSSTETRSCSSDGQTYTDTTCAAQTPTCTGQGVCTCADEPASVTCSGKCGTVTNNCGNDVACGDCTGTLTCGGAGTPNVCGEPGGGELCDLCDNHPDCPLYEPQQFQSCQDSITTCYYHCGQVGGETAYLCIFSTWDSPGKRTCPVK